MPSMHDHAWHFMEDHVKHGVKPFEAILHVSVRQEMIPGSQNGSLYTIGLFSPSHFICVSFINRAWAEFRPLGTGASGICCWSVHAYPADLWTAKRKGHKGLCSQELLLLGIATAFIVSQWVKGVYLPTSISFVMQRPTLHRPSRMASVSLHSSPSGRASAV